MKKLPVLYLFSIICIISCTKEKKLTTISSAPAPKPLYRDPVYDGAADPVVIWNDKEQRWFMFYTNRRANMQEVNGVDWVHGTQIGIAESVDSGMTWTYRCNANINYGEDDYTYWAPDIIASDGKYHMFLTIVAGTFTDWKHPREIVHLTSENLIDWNFESNLQLASDKVIDAAVFKTGEWWYMYYNNEKDHKSIYAARSKNLSDWENIGKVVDDKAGEGPKVFYWNNSYFMIVDNWDGLGVYSSSDLKDWKRQPENILDKPGHGKDDQTKGLHADVVINDGKAYIFYFTHPGRLEGITTDSYETRRSSIQVAELEYKDGIISCDRDKPVHINLKSKK